MSESEIEPLNSRYWPLLSEFNALSEENEKLKAQVEELRKELSQSVSRPEKDGVEWLRCSPGLPKYVHGLEAQVQRLREALEKVRGFGRGDMDAQQLADYVTEVADEALETREAR